MTDLIESELRESVLHIRLNRPEKLNAINDAILDGLLGVIDEARRDPASIKPVAPEKR